MFPGLLTSYLSLTNTRLPFSSLPVQRIPGKAWIGPLGALPNYETRGARDPAGSACWLGRWSWEEQGS